MQTRTNAVVTQTPDVDHTDNVGYFVDADGGLADATGAPFGVILDGGDPAKNGVDSIAICAGGYSGTVELKLAGTAAKGAFVGPDANGKASASATVKSAMVLEAGTADELVEAVLFKGE